MRTFKQFLAESKQLKENNNRAHIYFRKDLSDKEKNEIKKMLQGANVVFNDLLKNGYHPIYTDKNSLKDRWNKYADKILFESFSDNDILKRIKILSKDSNYEDLEPVLYQSTRGGKDELVIYHNNKPIIPDDEYSIISYTNGRERATDFASKNELETRYNKFHSPKYLKDFQQNQKIYWKSPKLNKFKLNESVEFDILDSANAVFAKVYTEPFLKLTKKFSSKVQPSKGSIFDVEKLYNSILRSNLNKYFLIQLNTGGKPYLMIDINPKEKNYNISILGIPNTISKDEINNYKDIITLFNGLLNVKPDDIIKAFQESIKNVENLMKEKGLQN